eukprot:4960065-Amphidinium_carterae.1
MAVAEQRLQKEHEMQSAFQRQYQSVMDMLNVQSSPVHSSLHRVGSYEIGTPINEDRSALPRLVTPQDASASEQLHLDIDRVQDIIILIFMEFLPSEQPTFWHTTSGNGHEECYYFAGGFS